MDGLKSVERIESVTSGDKMSAASGVSIIHVTEADGTQWVEKIDVKEQLG